MTATKPDAGRADYNQSDSFSHLEPGEPYFRVRARDKHAAATVRAWAALAYEGFAPMAVIEQALQQADRMDAWPDKRAPDARHLTDDQVLQLAFQFERRGWEARADSSDPRIMLAEERALTAALSRLRPVLTILFAGLGEQPDGSFLWTRPSDQAGKPVDWPCPFKSLRNLSKVLRPSPQA